MPDAAPPSSPPEPIAIIGIGCRLPGGADSPEALWRLLREGRDAIVDVPPDRWDLRQFHDRDSDLPAKSHARQGGFLREPLDAFDAAFFGFTPREAEELDPQQRLLLETTWEALERAGQDAARLRGSPTAVYVGGFCMDIQLQRLGAGSRHLINAFTATSFTLTMLANRLSHAFDFRGPSLALDTACSSSLVAVHLACSSLWRGEAAMAIAGGVNVMLRPEYAIAMSKGGFLSPQSRCLTFDERAAGYARGEGAAVVVLKPLAAARAAGDPIQAVIRATATNQDGRTPGITQPNAEAQQELMRRVYALAGVSPGAVAYVEAHGTGTQAGDAAEAASLGAVLRTDRDPAQPCWVGSIKTNIGHLEAAAGAAGLIKAALVLQHRQVPPNLHFQRPNPKIDFAHACLRVPTRLQPLAPPTPETAFAAVNSFGYGGTNAHLLLEAPPSATPASTLPLDPAAVVFPLSARDPQALRAMAARVAAALAAPEGRAALRDWVHSAALRRTHLEHRLAVIGGDLDALAAKLRQFAADEPSPDVVAGEAARAPAPLAFVFTGMGPQMWGMGAEAYAHEPEFRAAFDRVAAAFQTAADLDLSEVVRLERAGEPIADTVVAQAANFALQVALVALWESWGILPAAIVGHSTGEIAAAHVAGALTLEDAVAVCHHRSRLQQRLRGTGGMLAVGASAGDLRDALAAETSVRIAAINAPTSLTLAGPEAALDRIAAGLPATVFQRRLKVDIPYHGAPMQTIASDILAALATLRPAAPRTPLYSTVTGALVEAHAPLDAAYWVRNVAEPVRFADACRAMIGAGFSAFLEIGPHPVLADSLQQNLAAAGARGVTHASLRRQVPDRQQLRLALAGLYVRGHAVAWDAVAPRDGRCVAFPSYPWQRQRLWQESETCRIDRIGRGRHPFVDRPAAAPRPSWAIEVNRGYFPYLEDHRLGPAVVFPGAAYLEAALVLHREVFGAVSCVVEGLRFERMLVPDPKRPPTLLLEHEPDPRRFRLFSQAAPDFGAWTLHAEGQLHHLIEPPAEERRAASPPPGAREIAAAELYRQLERRGLHYGPWFRTVRRMTCNATDAVVHLRGHPQLAGLHADIAHPTLVDGALQALVALMPAGTNAAAYVPTSIGRIVCHAPLARDAIAHLHVQAAEPGRLVADITLTDAGGHVRLELQRVEVRALAESAEGRAGDDLYAPVWRETPPPTPAHATGVGHVCGGTPALRDALAARLAADGWSLAANAADLPQDGLAIVLGEAAASPGYETIRAEISRLLAIVQALAARGDVRLLLVAPACQVVTGREAHLSLAHLPWAGFAPAATNEGTVRVCRLVDLDLDAADAADRIALEARADDDDREVAWRDGQRFHRELQRVAATPAPGVPAISSRASYLITGGTRGFGLEVARWLAAQGAGRIVLASRAGRSTPGLAAALGELAATATQVEVAAIDVADEPALRDLLASLATHPLPLRGVFHGAMVLEDGFIRDQTPERLERVLRPKVGGALLLHRLTQEIPLDCFVCFSSVSALIGNPGQSTYAAANAFLDGLAHYRRRHGLPALAVDLGLLAETGVARDRAELQQALAAFGVHALSTAEALAGIAIGLTQRHTQLGVFRMDWPRWQQAFPVGSRDRRFGSVLGRGSVQGAPEEGAAIRRRLRGLAPEDRIALLVSSLRAHLAASLRVPATALADGERLGRMGVDSLAMVELVATINREFSVQLTPVDMLRQPTLRELAALVLQRIES